MRCNLKKTVSQDSCRFLAASMHLSCVCTICRLGRNNSSLKAVDYLIGKMSSCSNIQCILAEYDHTHIVPDRDSTEAGQYIHTESFHPRSLFQHLTASLYLCCIHNIFSVTCNFETYSIFFCSFLQWNEGIDSYFLPKL